MLRAVHSSSVLYPRVRSAHWFRSALIKTLGELWLAGCFRKQHTTNRPNFLRVAIKNDYYDHNPISAEAGNAHTDMDGGRGEG